MKDGPSIAGLAALIGDPARANILTALMDGRALTVSELAVAAGVGLPTASGHLAKLTEAKLLVVEKQGRHRYVRLADDDIAQVLEQLMTLAQRTGTARVRTGPNDVAMRAARVCYNHLAGEEGVAVLAGLVRRGRIIDGDQLQLTADGRAWFTGFGIAVDDLEKSRRPLCVHCLDWSERRHHLAGALGSALLDQLLARDWLRRGTGRVLLVTAAGRKGLPAEFGV